MLLLVLTVAVCYLLFEGVGIWGIDIPVAWGFAITSFVWWIGIGHAGTLISAILLLLHQKWRTSINRLAEAMTIFAVMCAGLFPLLHLGRPWFFYWLLPYPNTMAPVAAVPQRPGVGRVRGQHVFHRVAVVLVHGHDSRPGDAARSRQGRFARIAYGLLCLGWRDSARHWQRYETAYLLLGGLATPLVVSVHSVVSSDFAMSMLPGWHETVFPPYFVAGAIFSGFAMVLVLSIILRVVYGLEEFITDNHLDVMGKVLLATSLLTSYGYLSEQFFGVVRCGAGRGVPVSQSPDRLGQYAVLTWSVFFCNTVAPQVLWFQRAAPQPGGAVRGLARRAPRHVAGALHDHSYEPAP